MTLKLSGRGLWPPGTLLADLPRLFWEEELSQRRRAWFRSYLQDEQTCKVWVGGRDHSLPVRLGYGTCNIANKTLKVHRVAYALHYRIDPGELDVLHRCDNPPCARKTHLFLGTPSDNIADMLAKGRNNPARGATNAMSKLTDEKVIQLRDLYLQGFGYTQLGRQFGVAREVARNAVLGRTWQHVEGAVESFRNPHVSGEAHPHAKLNASKVKEIRALALEGWGTRRLSKKYGVSRPAIKAVLKGITWRGVL